MAAANLNGRSQFKWPQCSCLGTFIGYHTVPEQVHRQIKDKNSFGSTEGIMSIGRIVVEL